MPSLLTSSTVRAMRDRRTVPLYFLAYHKRRSSSRRIPCHVRASRAFERHQCGLFTESGPRLGGAPALQAGGGIGPCGPTGSKPPLSVFQRLFGSVEEDRS